MELYDLEGEYGILSVADVEVICANGQLEDLTEVTEALGGEPAAKDGALLKVEGFQVVKDLVARMHQISEQVQHQHQYFIVMLIYSYSMCFYFFKDRRFYFIIFPHGNRNVCIERL